MFAEENGLHGDPRIKAISDAIRVVPYFSKEWIMFQDIRILLLDQKAFKYTVVHCVTLHKIHAINTRFRHCIITMEQDEVIERALGLQALIVVGAEANLEYYFMETTMIIIENDPKRDVCSKDTLSFISNQSFTKARQDHMGAKYCCLMGLRKKRCGANWNEGGLSKEGYGARWKLMKVVLGVVVAAAEVGQQGHHVASFETKKCVEDRVGLSKDDVLGRCMLPLQYVDRRLYHKAINTRWFNLEKHVMVVEEEKKKEVKFASKIHMIYINPINGP
ncbi:hypothetical protein Tco_0554552 [Tanacetum coccineum]